jgi:hypothetical protein
MNAALAELRWTSRLIYETPLFLIALVFAAIVVAGYRTVSPSPTWRHAKISGWIDVTSIHQPAR